VELQEEAGMVVGLELGLFGNVVEAASKGWLAQWQVDGSLVGLFVGSV
jgi:hypothetical protein